MDTAGTVMILLGIYLLTSAIKNRRPIELAKAIVASPRRARELVETAEGYEATETGSPRFIGGSPVEVPTTPPDPTMSNPGGGMALAAPKPTGSAAELGLKPNAKNGLRRIAAAFPTLKSFGGRGARPIASSDHPRGLAVDFMIPKWNTKEGNALGWRVAEYVKSNAGPLQVKYIIWDAKKWNPAGGSGWRPYRHPLGGGPTLAHRDHVHVSFKG